MKNGTDDLHRDGFSRLLRSELLVLDRSKMEPWVALRNTAGVSLSILGGFLAGRPAVGLVLGIGALVVSFTDARDPYSARFRRMLAASLVCAISVFIGALSARSLFGASVIATAGAFVAGLVVVLGPTAADLGVFSMVMFVIFASRSLPLAEAGFFGLLTCAGGVLQTGLSLVFWPIRRHDPERRELGKLYLDLSRLAGSPARSRGGAPPGSARITLAQQALSSLREDSSLDADRYRALLNQAERIRLSLLLVPRLRRRLERAAPEEVGVRSAIDHLLAVAAALLSLVGQTLLVRECPRELRDLLRKMDEVLAGHQAPVAGGAARRGLTVLGEAFARTHALAGQLRAAADLARNTTPRGRQEFHRRESRRPWALRFAGTIATVRANLTPRSAAFRHGVRLAAAVAIGEATGYWLQVRRPYWIPMTSLIVLRPDYSGTLSRSLTRILGTLVGLLLATALFHYLPSERAIWIGLAGAFMFLLRWAGAANYAIFTMGVSGLVVEMIALTGVPPGEVILARGINTLMGGGIALLAYLLWPTWERTQVGEILARLLDAYQAYFHAVSRLTAGDSGERLESELARTRMNGRVARANFEASLARLGAERGAAGSSVDQRDLLESMHAASNRFAHAVMALEAAEAQDFSADERERFLAFCLKVTATMTLIREILGGKRASSIDLPDLRAAHDELARSRGFATRSDSTVIVETDRLTNSLNTLRELTSRWAAAYGHGSAGSGMSPG